MPVNPDTVARKVAKHLLRKHFAPHAVDILNDQSEARNVCEELGRNIEDPKLVESIAFKAQNICEDSEFVSTALAKDIIRSKGKHPELDELFISEIGENIFEISNEGLMTYVDESDFMSYQLLDEDDDWMTIDDIARRRKDAVILHGYFTLSDVMQAITTLRAKRKLTLETAIEILREIVEMNDDYQ